MSSKSVQVIKRSPFVILQQIVLINVVTIVLFLFSTIFVDYVEFFKNEPFKEVISLDVVALIVVLVLQLIFIVSAFLNWYFEALEISDGIMSYRRGLVSAEKLILPLKTLKSIAYRQGPLGRILDYGTVVLDNGNVNEKFKMTYVPKPANFVKMIQDKTQVKVVDILPGFSISRRPGQPDVKKIIAEGENDHVEFKETFRWDVNQQKPNRDVEKSVMKTLCGFMNSDGGYLLIGVADNKEIMGLERDYKTTTKHSADGFENHFNLAYTGMIGKEFRQYVTVTFHKIVGKEICFMSVKPSKKPVYLKEGNNEEFYIRTGNSTSPMSMSEANEYIKSHWK